MSRPAEPLADRLRRYVTEPDQNGCRLWLGYTNPQSGYGQITLSKRDIPVFGSRIATAPVVACTIAHGPRPDGLVVLHSCDVRRCCEPSHLRWGTPRANCREAWDRGGRKSGELHHR